MRYVLLLIYLYVSLKLIVPLHIARPFCSLFKLLALCVFFCFVLQPAVAQDGGAVGHVPAHPQCLQPRAFGDCGPPPAAQPTRPTTGQVSHLYESANRENETVCGLGSSFPVLPYLKPSLLTPSNSHSPMPASYHLTGRPFCCLRWWHASAWSRML